MTLTEELNAEVSAMWERIESRKVESPQPQPFQITQTVVQLVKTEQPPPADEMKVDNYAGDPVPNPDAQGL